MPFEGFPADAFAFYRELADNNEKPWWEANRSRYESGVKTPFEALAEELEPVANRVKIYRPYRDVRFSHDKTPYKTGQGLVALLAEGVGWFVNLHSEGVELGGGFYGDASLTKSYRAAVEAAAPGSELEAIVGELVSRGYELGGERLKTAPRGVDREHPRVELLRYKWLTASCTAAPRQAQSAAFLDTLFDTVDDVRPLVAWSARHVAPTR